MSSRNDNLDDADLAWARNLAKRYCARAGIRVTAELLHAAQVGLWIALVKFEPARDVSFRGWAWRFVRAQLIDETRRTHGRSDRRHARKLHQPMSHSQTVSDGQGDEVPLSDLLPGKNGDPAPHLEDDEAAVGLLTELHARCTDRQRQVLDLLIDGLTPTQIAKRLGVTVSDISMHRAAIKRKCGRVLARR